MARSFRALAAGSPVGSRLTVALALAVLWGVAGCTPMQQPPRPSAESSGWSAAPGGASDRQPITVVHGDSLYLIAKRYSVPMRELIDLNHLKPPYRLEAGQRLILPDTRTYTVVPGDRLSVLAQRFHVETAELARLNQLAPPYIIRVGQLLVLPGGAPGPASTVPSSGGKPEPVEPGPVRGPAPTIRTAALPPPPPPPPVSAPPPVAAYPPLPPRRPPSAVPPSAAPPPPARRPEPAPTPAAVPAAEAPPPRPAEASATPPAHGGERYLWPVQGKVVSGFGDKPDGRHNDGINIEAERGTAVVAADNGVVAYSGNELRGYGNLLLIRHADGYMTAYAHLDRAVVERGATVRRGDKIGVVGATGSVTEPQLHFEVRRGSQAVDPADFLGQSHPG